MRGVAAANAIGVVHRDLKPGNIFLCSDADGRVLAVKVLDFGISTTVNRAGERSTATDAMPMMGTPAYMAPEAIEYPSAVDSRADVYELGILFFETLTGQVPFPGEPGTELLVRIVHEPPPRVTEYAPGGA
jgi:serine/threonine-protein kinase